MLYEVITDVVNVEGQKHQDGENVLKLGDQGDLPLVLRIEDVGGGKSYNFV